MTPTKDAVAVAPEPVLSVPVPGPAAWPGMLDRGAERPTFRGLLGAVARYRELIRNLVMRDLKLKYRGSVLGFFWSLLNPIAMVGVYTLAFTYILRTTVEGFVFFLLIGILAWTFFANAATMSTGAIVDGGSLMRSVVFPRAILPIATVIFTLSQYLLTLLVLLPIMLVVYRVPPAAPMLLFPAFLVLHVLFTIGVALFLSVATAYFRDTRHLLDLSLSLLFWLTPIVYPLASVSPRLQTLLRLSPLSPFVLAYQVIFYYRQWPDAATWAAAVTYAAVALTVGMWVFLSAEAQLAERV